jgi:hypothetical protein
MQRREDGDGPRQDVRASSGTVAKATGVAYSCPERPHPPTPIAARQAAWDRLWDRLLAVPVNCAA